MHLKSPYPDVPPIPEVNAHNLFFHRPDQAEWKDFTLHVDAKTGKRRTFREFVRRVQLGMTVLGTPAAEGGLGFGTREDNEMIGIISHNCMVTIMSFLVLFALDLTLSVRTTSHSCSLSLVSPRHLRLSLRILHHSNSPMRSNCQSVRVCSSTPNCYLWFFQLPGKSGCR